ncbi:Hypothetical protein GLP15_140 [Giardia lamblia P15]|uniref:Uncharacterized protein n=1 Tax=Giardia intestinalis (strain P15) TaxID=658858 RepID=E1EY65_GIAIA|nr:Hypothetical protein GLP15_140 [Giardia lamblia P15]
MLIYAINSFFNLIRHLEATHITKTTFEEPKEAASEPPGVKPVPRPQIPRIDPDADLGDVMHLLFRRVVIPLYGRKLSKALPLLIAATEYFLSQKDLFTVDQGVKGTENGSCGYKTEGYSSQSLQRLPSNHSSSSTMVRDQASSSTKDSVERLAHTSAQKSQTRNSKTETQLVVPQSKLIQNPSGSKVKRPKCGSAKHATDTVSTELLPRLTTAPVAASSVFLKDNFTMENRATAQLDPSERLSERQNRSTLLAVTRLQSTGTQSEGLKSDVLTRSEPKLPTIHQRRHEERTSASAPPATAHAFNLPAFTSIDKPFYECSFFSCKTPIWDIIYYCWSLIDAICFLHNLTGEFAEAFSSLFEGCRNDYCTYMTDQIRRTPELSHAYRRNLNMVSGLNTTNGSEVKFYHLFFVKRDPMYFTRNYKCSFILQHAILIGGSSSDFLATLSYISGKLSTCVKVICDASDPAVQEVSAKLTAFCRTSDSLPLGATSSRYPVKETACIDARTYLSWLGLLGTSYTSVVSITAYRTLLNPYIKSTTPTHCCLSRLLTRVLQVKRRCILPPSLRFNKPYNPTNTATGEQTCTDCEPPLKKVKSEALSVDKPAEYLLSSPHGDPTPSATKSVAPRRSSTSNSDEIPWSTLFDDRDEHDTTLARAESYSSISLLSAPNETDTPVPGQEPPEPAPIPRYNIQLPPAPWHRDRFVPRALVGFRLVERVNGRCSRRDSNPRPFVRETNVITNYTTRARPPHALDNGFPISILHVFTCRPPAAGAAPRTPSVRPGSHTRARCCLR